MVDNASSICSHHFFINTKMLAKQRIFNPIQSINRYKKDFFLNGLHWI